MPLVLWEVRSGSVFIAPVQLQECLSPSCFFFLNLPKTLLASATGTTVVYRAGSGRSVARQKAMGIPAKSMKLIWGGPACRGEILPLYFHLESSCPGISLLMRICFTVS